MKSVKEVSRLSGVSVRTLHYYDEIDLLKPSTVTSAGYRLYDDAALRRLQSILLFRELHFSLKDIKVMLDHPEFDPTEALRQQITLLEMQRQHIEDVLALARNIQKKGANGMSFQAFHTSDMEKYTEEVKQRWGKTKAYEEYACRSKQRKSGELKEAGKELMSLLAEIGSLQSQPPESVEVQQKILALKQFITNHFYTCTNESLAGLGELYLSDQRMREAIDRAGGTGCSEFVSKAISAFCSKR